MRLFTGFSERDRKVLLLLEWLVVLLLGGFWMYHAYYPGVPDSDLAAADSLAGRSHRSHSSGSPNYVYAVEEEPVQTFPFDPNTADSTALLRLGLAPWQVRAIYRYRAKHGRYHTPEEFKRLPGMTLELWNRIGPFVRIAQEFRYLDVHPRSVPSSPASSVRDTAPTDVPALRHTETFRARTDSFPRVEKYPVGTIVDVNVADTTELKKIPGIGSYRARKIVSYRQALGGYCRAQQVMEACDMPDDVLPWFGVGNPQLRPLHVNQLSIQRLMRHPYVSFYQARAIVELRQRQGAIRGLSQLEPLPEFSSADIDRLRAYLSFEVE